MAINSKSKNKIRVVISAVVILLLAVSATAAAEKIWQRTERGMLSAAQEEDRVTEGVLNTAVVQQLYRQFCVLYAECMQQEGTAPEEIGSVFLEERENEETGIAKAYLSELISSWKDSSGNRADYYYTDGVKEKLAAPVELQKLCSKEAEEILPQVREEYRYCVVLSVDGSGNFSVQLPYSVYQNAYARVLRAFFEEHRSNSPEEQLWAYIWAYMGDYGEEGYGSVTFRKMQSFEAVLAVPYYGEESELITFYDDSDSWFSVRENGGDLLFFSLPVCMLLLVLVLRSKKIWGEAECAERKGKRYFAEAAVVGLCFAESMYHNFSSMICSFRFCEGRMEDVGIRLSAFATALTVELVCFACFWYLRPVFTLGIKEYIRQYSVIYLFCKWCKEKWRRFIASLDSVDFSEKSSKLLLKAVLVNFFILLVCVSCWFFGIVALVIYSVVLFCYLKSHYDKAAAGYAEVLREAGRIAEGEVDGPVEGEFGMFASLGEELGRVKEGFRKAVEKEVKSERMKTELITNVSHDLKTPLTAIMTYVELLKKEDITEEERSSYIATLEKKSKRLKVLIEDLFEVSRAASNNLTLNLMEVDLVQLVKQVAVEYEDRFAKAGLNLRQTMPEERLPVQLDGQKTSRILENLFTNICKYALPGSRVYAEAAEKDGMVRVVLKNISAEELTVSAEEIVERFVRGDASRNTEGSGLGLAIAKNLTEAQGGTFAVEIDGDLFKAEIAFPIKEQ